MRKAVYYMLLFLLISWTAALAASTIYQFAISGNAVHSLGKEAAASVPVEVNLVAMIVADIIIFYVFLWRKYCPVSRDYMRSRPLKVALWCVVASLGTIIPSMWLEEQLSFLPNISQSADELLGSPLGYIAVVVCVPICEEVVFRGAVIRALLGWRNNGKLAVIVSAIMFAVVHVNPAQMPHAFLLGLLLGWVFVRTDSVIPGIIIHGTNNLIVFIIAGALSGSGEMTLSDLYGGSTLHVVLSVLFSLLILLPALFQLNLAMKR